MLGLQVKVQSAWLHAREREAERFNDERDRGEVTSHTAMTVILVIAAIAAAAVIATKIGNNAAAVPEP
jgi:hypothetical protein